MINNIAAIISNIAVTMLSDSDIIHIICDIIEADIYRNLDFISRYILHLFGNRNNPWIIIYK